MHKTLTFNMPANASVVFDAFHYHQWRAHWDSLVGGTQVLGGGECPYVGAITQSHGGGMLRLLSMRTEFVTYDRPKLAAAKMLGASFPFTRWAASMRHRSVGPQQSMLIYSFTFEVGPAWLRGGLEPMVGWVFTWQTRRRFKRLQGFLSQHASDVEAWRCEREVTL